MKETKQLSKIFKALSSPHRLELYLRIKRHYDLNLGREKKRTCFLSSLCEGWNVGAPTISHHLKELVNAGLIKVDKDGKFVTCELNAEVAAELRETFE
ncbi:MAG: ArsR/SmtB family transcription factor [Bdellovibrio sp.]